MFFYVSSVFRDHTIIDNRMKIERKDAVLICWYRSGWGIAIRSSCAKLRRRRQIIVLRVSVKGEEHWDKRLMREIWWSPDPVFSITREILHSIKVISFEEERIVGGVIYGNLKFIEAAHGWLETKTLTVIGKIQARGLLPIKPNSWCLCMWRRKGLEVFLWCSNRGRRNRRSP